MTAGDAKKGRRASARRSPGSAPDERLDRLEAMMQTMLETMVAKGSVGVKLIQPEDMAAVDEDDREDDREAARAAKQRQREREAEEDRAAVEALILIDPRHREIFDWLLRIEGKTAAQLLKEILRSALIRERPAYREAHGKGGNSSRDIGALAERLPGKK